MQKNESKEIAEINKKRLSLSEIDISYRDKNPSWSKTQKTILTENKNKKTTTQIINLLIKMFVDCNCDCNRNVF